MLFLVSSNAKIFSRCLLFPISTYWAWIIIWQNHRENQCGFPHSPTFVFLVVLWKQRFFVFCFLHMLESKSEVSTVYYREAIKSRSMLSGFILSFTSGPPPTSPCALDVTGICPLGYRGGNREPRLPQGPPLLPISLHYIKICPFAMCFWDLLNLW